MTEKQIFQDLGTFVSAEMSDDKKRVIVKFSPTTGKFAGKEFSRSAFVTALDEATRSTIKSLSTGEPITIETVVNGTFRNLKSISKGHKKIEKKVASSGNNDYNQRAARGQLVTQAFAMAIADGRHHDKEYILSLVPFINDIQTIVQEAKDVSNLNEGPSTQTTNDATSSSVQPSATVTATTTGIQSSAATTPSGTPAIVSDDTDDLSDLLDL